MVELQGINRVEWRAKYNNTYIFMYTQHTKEIVDFVRHYQISRLL